MQSTTDLLPKPEYLSADSAFIEKPMNTKVIGNFCGVGLDADRLQLHDTFFLDFVEKKHRHMKHMICM